MVKVMPSTGAVAVYSPLRATALVGAIALLLGGAGFGLAMLTEGDSRASATAPTVEPAATPVKAAPVAEPSRARIKAAYRRGRAAGRRRALERSALPVGAGLYFMKVVPGPEDTAVLGRNFRLEEGRLYGLCRGGESVCFRPGTIAPPPG